VPADGAEKVPGKEERRSMVTADLTVGGERGKARQKPRSTRVEDGDRVTFFRIQAVPIKQLRKAGNTREGHQGNYLTDSRKLATTC